MNLVADKSWIQTFSGKPFWPMSPRIGDIDIEDIAHSLAFQCRYNGHTKIFYSVAEHSVWISLAVAPEFALWGLLHDASEAYLCDIPRPLKPLMPEYKEAEKHLMSLIAEKFGLSPEEPPQVKEMDTRILFNERDALLHKSILDWELTGEPIPNIAIIGFNPESAEQIFLERFYAINRAIHQSL